VTPPELLLQVSTVFLGAFLAFWLENHRERQKLRAWVRSYLRQVRESLDPTRSAEQATAMKETLKAYSAFLAFDDAHHPSDEEWSKLLLLVYAIHSDYNVLLQSEAVRVLPTEVVKGLSELQNLNRADEIIAEVYHNTLMQLVTPIALKGTLPLNAAEKRGLETMPPLLEVRLAYTEKRQNAEQRVLELLDQYGLF